MSDVIDQGCRFETQFTEVALANQLARAKQTEQRESAQKCSECGEQIPQKRREKVPGCQCCVMCQQLRE